VLIEGNFSFEKEDCLGIILGFLNNFSGSGIAAIGSGFGFFLVNYFFVDEEEVGGVLGPSLLGARITTEESPSEKSQSHVIVQNLDHHQDLNLILSFSQGRCLRSFIPDNGTKIC
jgi:hypothetical protein